MSDKISKGRDLAFDVSRQFLTLALGGIAFAIGVTGSHPDAFGTTSFWAAIGFFGLSIVAGFMFLMHAVSSLAQDKALDVYHVLPRILILIQVPAVVIGAALLLFLHAGNLRDVPKITSVTVEILVGGKKTTVTVPAGSTLEASIAPDNTVKAFIK